MKKIVHEKQEVPVSKIPQTQLGNQNPTVLRRIPLAVKVSLPRKHH
jgi:hypothetical protein